MELQRNCNHAYDKILKEVIDKDQSFTKLSNDTVRTINDFTKPSEKAHGFNRGMKA